MARGLLARPQGESHLVTKHCGLAERKTIQAYYLHGTMAIFATGQVPSPIYQVSIERDPAAPSGCQFYLACRQSAGIVTPSETPYAVSQLFPTTQPCQRVRIQHAGGVDEIEVEQVHSDTNPSGQPPPYIFPPSAIRGASDATTAIGYSCRFDFGEALHHAVAALPAIHLDATATPDCVTVLEIGAEVGGIAGFDHLFVRVRRMSEQRRIETSDPFHPHQAPQDGPALTPSLKG